MNTPIYLDYMSTTPMDKRVVNEVVKYMDVDGCFGNPSSSTHRFGIQASAAVEKARKNVAKLINAEPFEVFFTSGATESDNLAIRGAALFHQRRGKHLITSEIEHKAVLDVFRQLEREGFEVTYLKPDENGLVSASSLSEAIRDDTILVSLMYVNNEIGTIQDVEGYAAITSASGVLLHVDASQAAGKLPIDLKKIPIDLLSLTAHKIYGPKGVGALYIKQKPKVRIQPVIFGGGQEQGVRPGTLPTHQIVGFGEACKLALNEMGEEQDRLVKLRNKLWLQLKNIEGIRLNGDLENRIGNNLNVCFEGLNGESLIFALKDIAVSSGSACTSSTVEPSYVLRAMGVPDLLADTAIRISIGRFTTEEEVDYCAQYIQNTVKWLQEIGLPKG